MERGENLFEQSASGLRRAQAPLPARMRPRTLDEFVGQDHVVGPGTLLRAAIEAGAPPSCILCGPAGTGKTTLARLMANYTSAEFVQLSAVATNVAEVRRLIDDARYRLTHFGRRTVVFLDEIHRFNRAQQDVLLPAVEDGTVILVGATTENPSFALTSALLSRCRLYRLEPLGERELTILVERALADAERGLGHLKPALTNDALSHLVRAADGDARVALSALEMAVRAVSPDDTGVRTVTLPVVAEALQRRVLRYDREGDQHYDTISAFIKSLRGSDPDAALYWLARMIQAGEDPRFIARRMIIAASEDVGNADPRALMVAVAAYQAAELVGWPEARIPLAQAAAYIATAPKSNAALGIDRALADVRAEPAGEVPVHLRSSVYPEEGRRREDGSGTATAAGGRAEWRYLYPHDYVGHHVGQQYLPAGKRRGCYYVPSDQGYEATLRERLLRWWPELRSQQGREGPRAKGK